MILFFSFRIPLSPSFYTSSPYSVARVTSFDLNTQILITMNPFGYLTFLAQLMSMFSKPLVFDSVYRLELVAELFSKTPRLRTPPRPEGRTQASESLFKVPPSDSLARPWLRTKALIPHNCKPLRNNAVMGRVARGR